MSMAMEFNAARIDATRQIDEQMSKLNGYLSELDQVMGKVQLALDGSQQDYGTKMISQLTATKKQVQETIAMLGKAKDKLFQVRI